MTDFIKLAISDFGSQKAFANAIGVSQPAVHKWLRGSRVKPENAISIEKATSGKVTKEQIRPDIFTG